MVTWLGLLLSYPTIRYWTMSSETMRNMPEQERLSLMRRAAVAGIDLAGGYRFEITADASALSERGQATALNQIADILRKRLYDIGIIEARVHYPGGNTLIAETPVSADTVLIRRLLGYSGLLTFHLFKDGTETQALRQRIDAALAARAASDSAVEAASVASFSGLLASMTIEPGVNDIVVAEENTPAVRVLLADSTVQSEIQAFNRANPPPGGFLWAEDPVMRAGRPYYPLYFVKQEPDIVGNPLAGARVTETTVETSSRLPFAVRVLLNEEGRDDLTNISSANVGKRLAIAVNNQVITTLTILGRIPDGQAEIPGGETLDRARVMAVALESGVLPLTVKVTPGVPIGPSVDGGAAAVRPGATAIGIGFLLTSIVLLARYRVSGAIAVLGLVFHLAMTGAVLRLWIIAGITPVLTLSGFIGLGFSVLLVTGSHILIFEQLRERLAEAQTPRNAVIETFASVTPSLAWLHATILAVAAAFIGTGAGPVMNGAIAAFSGTAASLLTSLFMTRTLFTLATREWTPDRLSV